MGLHMFVAASKKTIDLKSILKRVAIRDTSIYLNGPTGSGKEVAASYIHKNSPRAKQPFIAINCGALPQNMIESELFGYERGAFTGAVTSREGHFEKADRGTLFLDEIGEMSLDAQKALLRVLETKEIERIGGKIKNRVDVRIICATNRSLYEEVQQGRFREDLYFRLNVFPVRIPPLSERIDDIPPLVAYFSSDIEEEFRPRFSACALRKIIRYKWPGNIREIRNFIQRASIMFPNTVIDEGKVSELLSYDHFYDRYEQNQLWNAMNTAADEAIKDYSQTEEILKTHNSNMIEDSVITDHNILETPHVLEQKNPLLDMQKLIQSGQFDLKDHIKSMERQFVDTALSISAGSVSAAARLLGMQRTTLIEKMKRFEQAVS
jgi:sigma-54 specific flagellar transcriptional regulator A